MSKRFFWLAAMLLLIVSTSLLAQNAKQLKPTARVFPAVNAPSAQEVVFDQLPNPTRADFAKYREAPEPRNPYFTQAQMSFIKAQAQHGPAVSRPNDSRGGGKVPLRVSAGDLGISTPGAFANFAGATESDACSGLTPSDMGLAVSPAYVVQTTNACVLVTNKTGGAGVEKTLDAVLGWPAGTFTFDPRATYDFAAGRFIIVASTIDSGGTAWIDVAASMTNNPNGAYAVYHLPTPSGTTVADYPTLGQNWYRDLNDGGIYVCYNQFVSSGFAQSICLFLPKSKIYRGVGFSYYGTGGFGLGSTVLDTIQPVNVADQGEKPRTEFAIDAVNTNGGGVCSPNFCSGLVVWSFANTLVRPGTPGPVVTGIFTGFGSTSQYNYPGAADNAAFCSACIETIDNRITGMVQYSGGRLFPTIDTNNAYSSAVLGWIVRPFLDDNNAGCSGTFTNACPDIIGASIESEFCYDCGAGQAAQAFFGTIAPTQENNWTMFATFSNNAISPGTFYTSNRVTWATPFHDGGIFACQNNAAYTQGRWGDYTAAAPDFPGVANSPATWGSGMYILASGSWGTCTAGNRFVTVKDP